MKEEAFRQQVRKIARMYGWTMQYHTHDSRRSDRGFPDEVWINKERRRILFIEFKNEKGRVTQAQQEWLEALSLIGQEAALWRPKDMDLILEVLGPKQRSLLDGSTNPVRLVSDEGPEEWVFPNGLTPGR